jgi:hypothetical protein
VSEDEGVSWSEPVLESVRGMVTGRGGCGGRTSFGKTASVLRRRASRSSALRAA